MTPVLQRSIPYRGWSARPLPGVQPLDPADWLIRDEAFDAQTALKARLLDLHGKDVLDRLPESRAAEQELCEVVSAHVAARFPEDRPAQAERLEDLVDLAQEDFAILQKDGDEHVLTAALLGFPASWRLAEKIGKPLSTIHDPVGEYDQGMARRVQRMFDAVKVGRPLWRYNCLWYQDPALYQPRSEVAPRTEDDASANYLRSERQCILRLPKTNAVVFSIHTWVLARADVPATPDK